MSRYTSCRAGSSNPLVPMVAGSLVVLGLLGYLLFGMGTKPGMPTVGDGGGPQQELFMYCAAGMRPAVEKIAADYQQEYGVSVQLQYGGSNTLLSQLKVSQTGDLYLAADDSYTQLAHDAGLVAEQLPIAKMRPVIAVQQGNPKQIKATSDLLREDVRVALGNPDQAAVGKKARQLLTASGHWQALEQRVRDSGVFKPTVNELANDIKLGAVDAGIVWDSLANQYDELEGIRTPELDAGKVDITIGVMTSSKNPTAALKFARYLSARDKGLVHFKNLGYEPIEGDLWKETPELTFFIGSVNRRAVEPIIAAFQQREGVQINTNYNGCGILTAQMRSINKDQASGFPDFYMACDVYYLETVADLFQQGVNISNADIVIVVQEGNPKGIKTLEDLARPGMRVALGQPEQCTIGVLSRRLLEGAGVYEKLFETENVVTQTATSSLLVPSITTAAADAALAYRTDTLAESDKVDVVAIDSPLAKAVQPYSIAKSSNFKHLGDRLLAAIGQGKDYFEQAGFSWQLDGEDAGEQAKDGIQKPGK